MANYRIEPLHESLDVDAFACGHPSLDDYIRRYASQDLRRNLARVFVAVPLDEARRLAGFFTLSAASVSCSELPERLARKLPRYPVPVALIGRLAVDRRYQGKGLGSVLLADACRRVAQASSALAVVGIIVDAKDAAACSFYGHFGFQPLPGQTQRLLLPAAAFLP